MSSQQKYWSFSQAPIFSDGSETDESRVGFLNICRNVSVSTSSETSSNSDLFLLDIPTGCSENITSELISRLTSVSLKTRNQSKHSTESSVSLRSFSSYSSSLSDSCTKSIVDKNNIKIEIYTTSPNTQNPSNNMESVPFIDVMAPSPSLSTLSINTNLDQHNAYLLSPQFGTPRTLTPGSTISLSRKSTPRTLSPISAESTSAMSFRPRSSSDDRSCSASSRNEFNTWNVLPPIKQRFHSKDIKTNYMAENKMDTQFGIHEALTTMEPGKGFYPRCRTKTKMAPTDKHSSKKTISNRNETSKLYNRKNKKLVDIQHSKNRRGRTDSDPQHKKDINTTKHVCGIGQSADQCTPTRSANQSTTRSGYLEGRQIANVSTTPLSPSRKIFRPAVRARTHSVGNVMKPHPPTYPRKT